MQIQLSVEESLRYAQDSAYWDGFVAGANAAADHAKNLALQKLISERKTQEAKQEVASEIKEYLAEQGASNGHPV